MSDIILHHYPQSPAAEKIRVVLGIKNISWRSVQIPRLPPKPDLMPLTGGYRRTPVLQVGAHVYCDGQRIIRELEQRFPEPSLYPGGAEGMVWGISRWTDTLLFKLVIAVVFGGAQDLPEDFARDRGRLYFGEGFSLEELKGSLAHNLAQLRGQLLWMDERVRGGRAFFLGERPGLPDALAYHLVWFVRGRYSGGPALLSQFSALEAWEARVRDLGHGTPSDLSAAEALEIARAADPGSEGGGVDPQDPQGLKHGMRVLIHPDDQGGDSQVRGEVVRADALEVAVRYEHERVGEVVVHFPRVGYQVVVQ